MGGGGIQPSNVAHSIGIDDQIFPSLPIEPSDPPASDNGGTVSDNGNAGDMASYHFRGSPLSHPSLELPLASLIFTHHWRVAFGFTDSHPSLELPLASLINGECPDNYDGHSDSVWNVARIMDELKL